MLTFILGFVCGIIVIVGMSVMMVASDADNDIGID